MRSAIAMRLQWQWIHGAGVIVGRNTWDRCCDVEGHAASHFFEVEPTVRLVQTGTEDNTGSRG